MRQQPLWRRLHCRTIRTLNSTVCRGGYLLQKSLNYTIGWLLFISLSTAIIASSSDWCNMSYNPLVAFLACATSEMEPAGISPREFIDEALPVNKWSLKKIQGLFLGCCRNRCLIDTLDDN